MSETNSAVVKKLQELEGRFAELENQLHDPAVATDSTRLVAITKEQGKLRLVVTKYRSYKKLLSEIKQAQTILNDAQTEEEFRQLAAEELKKLQKQSQLLFEQIKDSLIMSDDEAVGSVIMEIRAGTGGDEAALFARDLYDMYITTLINSTGKLSCSISAQASLEGFVRLYSM